LGQTALVVCFLAFETCETVKRIAAASRSYIRDRGLLRASTTGINPVARWGRGCKPLLQEALEGLAGEVDFLLRQSAVEWQRHRPVAQSLANRELASLVAELTGVERL
jgi:hypothetical protein